MPSGIFPFTKVFVGQGVQDAFAVTQQYAAARFGPQLMPPPPPPQEPYQYLPPQGPYSTGATWRDGCGTCATMLEITALFAGMGALLGISAELCIGREQEKGQPVETVEQGTATEPSEESEVSESISNFSGWADKHYDARPSSSEGEIREVNDLDIK